MNEQNLISDDNTSEIIKSKVYIQSGNWKLDLISSVLTLDEDNILMLSFMGFENIPNHLTLLEFSERYMHPEDIPFIQERFLAAFENKDNLEYADRFEYRILAPDKSEHIILTNANIQGLGKVGGQAQNITDLKSVESKFLNQEIGFRSVINNTTDYFFSLDQEGKYVLWNKGYADCAKKYFNVDIELGMVAEYALPKDQKNDWVDVLNRSLAGETILTELSLDLDQKYYYEVAANPVRGINNVIQGVTFWVKDITDKKLLANIDLLESRVLNYSLKHTSIDDSLFLLLNGVEELCQHLKTYVTIFDPEHYVLRWKCAPKIPESYLKVIPTIVVGLGMGSCGTAAFTQKPVFVKDIATSEDWKSFRDISLLNGFKACSSFPIINANGKLLGTLGSYLLESRDFDPIEQELIERAVKLAGILLDRNDALNAAQEKQNQLHKLSQSIPAIIYEIKNNLSGERRFTYVSEKSTELLGFSPEELINDYSKIWKNIYPDDLESVRSSLRESINGLIPWKCEFRILKVGSITPKWFRASSEHILNDDDSFSTYGTIFDIDNLKKSEQSLRKKEEELSAMISSFDDIIFEMSREGKFVNVWTSDETKLVLPRNEFIGKTLESILNLEISDKYNDAVNKVLNNGKPSEFEYTLVANNQDHYFKAKVGLIIPNNIEEYHFFVTIKDITELKLIEESSLKMQRILNEAGKMAKVGAFEFDIVNNNLFWSNEVYSIFEIPENFFGIDLLNAYYKTLNSDDLEKLNKLVETAILNGESYKLEHKITLDNNIVKWVSCKGQPIKNTKGEIISIQGVIQDITEMKNSASLLHQMDMTIEAVANCSVTLLIEPDIENALEQVISKLGKSVMSCRAYIVKNKLSSWTKNSTIKNYYEWICPNYLENKNFIPNNLESIELPPVFNNSVLSNGDVFKGRVVDLPKSDQEYFSKRNIKSTLIIPININNDNWGFLGFEECVNDKVWLDTDEVLLKNAAVSIANALEKRKFESALLESEILYRTVVNNLAEGVMILNHERIIIAANSSASKILGKTKEELSNLPIDSIIWKKVHVNGSTYNVGDCPFMITLKTGQEVTNEIMGLVNEEENIKWISLNSKKLTLRGENTSNGVVVSFIDITDRRNSDSLVAENLKEKELLLAEIHHRVKNNLAIISSLFQLQQLYSKDETLRTIIKDGQSRLVSMALVHEKLYQNGNFTKVDFNQYIKDITTHIKNAFANPETEVEIIANAESWSMDITSAVPCGLILNEILTNAFKYAFIGRSHGQIKINFNKSGKYFILELIDNGVGLPQKYNAENPNSLGLTLVKTLTQQLKGNLEVKSVKNEGLSVRITFPDTTII